ncbi:MAG TPA: hypothetical protein VGP47_05290 [Parachlamydiaceae bacterium]|nr:hypothetical protein [Parachlamydiaceae bacterium]
MRLKSLIAAERFNSIGCCSTCKSDSKHHRKIEASSQQMTAELRNAWPFSSYQSE